jgi:hypothetical protein
MNSDLTCPSCGYSFDKNYNISSEISRLLKARSKKTIKYLNKIASKVTSNLHFETRINYFRFLFGIQSIDDHVVEWGIEQYYQKRYYTSGKGFAYLRKIIQNRNQNIGVLKKNERAMLGSPPPVIEIEE